MGVHGFLSLMAARLTTLFVFVFLVLQTLLGQGALIVKCRANHINSVFTFMPVVIMWQFNSVIHYQQVYIILNIFLFFVYIIQLLLMLMSILYK